MAPCLKTKWRQPFGKTLGIYSFAENMFYCLIILSCCRLLAAIFLKRNDAVVALQFYFLLATELLVGDGIFTVRIITFAKYMFSGSWNKFTCNDHTLWSIPVIVTTYNCQLLLIITRRLQRRQINLILNILPLKSYSYK